MVQGAAVRIAQTGTHFVSENAVSQLLRLSNIVFIARADNFKSHGFVEDLHWQVNCVVRPWMKRPPRCRLRTQIGQWNKR